MAVTIVLATLELKVENNIMNTFISGISNFPKDIMNLRLIQLTWLQEIKIKWWIFYLLMDAFLYWAEWQFQLVVCL